MRGEGSWLVRSRGEKEWIKPKGKETNRYPPRRSRGSAEVFNSGLGELLPPDPRCTIYGCDRHPSGLGNLSRPFTLPDDDDDQTQTPSQVNTTRVKRKR